MGIPGYIPLLQCHTRASTLTEFSILKEIGKGERVALAKLAIEHLERSQRPLRIAIDAAIWNFQTQAGQGGKNPALRTLFYRLLKLLALPIDPVFVYDGKNKPLTKRGKTVSRYGSCISNEMSKKLIQAFRFPHHTAPGEAEAECAMLQKQGLVDAVMSQDVDAIMFGSALTLRDWSKEASKHNKSPTHVNVLDLPRIKSLSGLDPDGMILVALLSGGDYDEAGVAGIGSTLACEIARAGFGADLLDLVRKNDQPGLQEWRERLEFELETNESGYFKMRRKALKIPESFPDRRILDYYMNPAVTPEDQLAMLERKWLQAWESDIDVQALRNYVAETFDWLYKPGAWKFVRVMAPSLLANRLRRGTAESHVRSVEQITERRKHFVSDGIPELRVTVIPADVVGLDLEAEEDSPEYLEGLAAEESGEVDEGGHIGEHETAPSSPAKKRKSPPWLPDAPEKMWIAETLVDMGARVHADRWRQIQAQNEADPKKFATRKIRKQQESRKHKDTGGMQAGALLGYVVAAKPSADKVVSAAKISTSPVRRKADTIGGDHQLPTTPTKIKSTQHESSRSPIMEDFFKASRSQQALNAVGKVSKQPKGESRVDIPSTRGMPLPLEQTSLEQPILISSSPFEETLRIDRTRGRDEAIPDPSDIPDTVTRRKNKRQGKSAAASLEPEPTRNAADPSPLSSTPTRPKRPLVSFFAPYIAATQHRPTPGGTVPQQAKEAAGVIPPGLAEETRTNRSARHVTAIPRSSLPGTWREGESELNPVSPRKSSRRAPRVSIVDLTEG